VCGLVLGQNLKPEERERQRDKERNRQKGKTEIDTEKTGRRGPEKERGTEIYRDRGQRNT
jgi:hypothetical protein